MEAHSDQNDAMEGIQRRNGVITTEAAGLSIDLRQVESFSQLVEALSLITSRLPQTTMLNLAGTELSDDLLPCLGRLSGLQHLDLHGTKITDWGVEHLATLPSLTTLNLGATKITDGSVNTLARLVRLTALTVPRRIPMELVIALKNSLPNVKWVSQR